EATGKDLRFAVPVDEPLLPEGGDEAEAPPPPLPPSSTARSAHPADNDVASSTGAVHTPPCRRRQGCVLPSEPASGRPALPSSSTPDSAGSAASRFARGEDEFHGSAADDPSAYAGMSALSGASAPSPAPAPRRPALAGGASTLGEDSRL